MIDFGIEKRPTRLRMVTMMCAPMKALVTTICMSKRAFRIGVICAILTLVAKVIVKIQMSPISPRSSLNQEISFLAQICHFCPNPYLFPTILH